MKNNTQHCTKITDTIRTIQVINVRWFNATAWYALELSRLLQEAGHPTLVIMLENTEAYNKAVEMGIVPICLPLNTASPIVFAKNIRDIQRYIKSFKPTVVNCHRGESFVLWAMMKSRYDYALVRTRGDQRLPKKNVINRILHTKVADAIVATNKDMAVHFSSEMGVNKERIHTIIGGVDIERFKFSDKARSRLRRMYGYEDKHFVIGLLGRFDVVKGQKILIKAFSRLVDEGHKDIRLLLIGYATSTSQEEVEGWIEDAGIGSYVTITGHVDDIPGHISCLDLGVVASLYSEAIARAALEIMAVERPLIATRVGVMPDFIPEDALAYPNNIVALTGLLKKAIVDTNWREDLAKTCYKRIQTLTSNDFLHKSLAMYHDALAVRLSQKV